MNYLRKLGFKIGDNTYLQSPKTFRIDLTRPSLITIGSDCFFNVRNSLIAHDVASRVFIKKYNDYLPSEGRISIGNNVVFGSDVTVLKGVTIGDNCIIGLGSVVTRDIPSNSVAIVAPAKIVCTLDEFYEKRKNKSIEESFEYARSIVERYGRRPIPADFWDSFVFFVSGEDMDQQWVKSIFAKQVGKVADYWFSCSDKAAERLFGNAYSTYPHYYDIPNAINAENYLYDPDRAREIRKQLGIGEDEFLCGHVGTFSDPKNHSFLIDVFYEVLKIKPNARLVCCGAGVLMPKVKAKAEALEIAEKISFPGVVKNCNVYLMAMDVMVFPSLFEGFPITVIEAEATGLPVVMSDVITHEVDLTALIDRHSLTDSPQDWARTVCEVKNIDRRAQNRSIAESKYNMRTSIKMITNIYQEMLKQETI